ncbi:GNAT family N-acetyltransferase [Pseudonocardia charpentierae]|uniref:GNAT family N-acetyltransferase n=1 Tax=Pseudonocardia charpentierae TaxID=3075545 RepID=A0ABU2N6G7_9PSEU|nr:GNAT family N-acetyltransferase [Pseudonocardia sp. DSM 45834]MDT0349532.1 GNAT family N-acetyltransferase [Pseudonocardia sp. DSM 45834]
MTNSMWNVRELVDDEWELLCEARLEALKESPQAFLSRHDHVSSWGEPEWRATFIAARWVVVAPDCDIVGLLHSVRDRATPRSREVQSIWVRPEYRKRGVFRSMLNTLAKWEWAAGARDLWLWVLEDNHDAQRAYEHVGFCLEGEPQPLPDVPNQSERRMRMPLTGSPSS